MQEPTGIERIAIESLLLCERAEVLNGKLYLMGGAVDWFTVGEFPSNIEISVGMTFRVPWNETNRPFQVRLGIETEDGQQLGTVDATLTVGRPPHLPSGYPQLTAVAIPRLVIRPEQAGRYRLTVSLNEEVVQRVPFIVVQVPVAGLGGARW